MAHKKQRVNHPLSCVSQCVERGSSDSDSRLFDSVEQTSLDKVGSLTDSIEERGVCSLNIGIIETIHYSQNLLQGIRLVQTV